MQGRKTVLFLFFLLLPLCCFSQNSEKVPLIQILKQISETHNVKFNQIDEELAVYALVPPNPKLSLQEKLNYIKQNTRLEIEAVSSTHYTVYNDIRMDKPLCGYLIDAETGTGIENAEIIVSGMNITVSSDANGYFKLPVLAPNTIYVKHLAYKPLTVSPQDLYVPNCSKLIMDPVVVQLEEVVTQRYLATGISKKEFGELVVKPRKFGILPGLTEPDVLQTMQQVPGIISIDETISNISVRGGSHDQNLFMWNGIRMFQTGHFFGLISAFNPLEASNISIYKNGSPAFFGESVSSLVNISTQTEFEDSCYNVITVDMINANFMSQIKLSEKERLQFAGRRTYSDLFVTPTFKDYEERIFQNTVITDITDDQQVQIDSDEEFHFYDLSLQYEYLINDKHKLTIDAIGMENELKVQQQSAQANKNSELGQTNAGGSIDFASKWNDRHHTDFQAYISWYELDANSEVVQNAQVTHQENSVLDKGFRFKYTNVYSPAGSFSAGYQLNEISITNLDEVDDPPFFRKSKEVSLSHALVGEWKYQSGNGFTTLNAGVRANYFQKFELFIAEPRVTFGQVLGSKVKLEIIGEQKSQTVSQIIDMQQDFLGIEKRRWVLSNDADIPVQRSNQASLGLTYTYNGWLVTAEGFYKKVKGITSDGQGFQNQFEFVPATGSYNVTGTEVLLQKSFKRFYSWVSYSYNNNEYDFEAFTPSQFPNNFEISHAVAAAGIYEWNKLRIAIGAKWRTGKPTTQPEGFTIDPNNPANSQIFYGEPNNTNLDDYLQVNFSASKTWAFGKKTLFTVSGSVLNILDKENLLNRNYRINTANNSVESVDTYSLGFTPNLLLKIVF